MATERRARDPQDDVSMRQIAADAGLTLAQFMALTREEFEAVMERVLANDAARLVYQEQQLALARSMVALCQAYGREGEPFEATCARAGIALDAYPSYADQYTADDTERFCRAVAAAVARQREETE
jgi:hypothetical protein